jgi:hypothetical protein
MQVHHDGDHSLACLDLYTCAINLDSFVRRRSLNLLLKYSSETTRLSAERPSGAKQCSSLTQSRLLAAEYKNSRALLYTWQKHTKEVIREGVSQGVWQSKFDLLCRVQTRPSSQCQFRRKKEMEFVRQVSLLSEINQQLK